MITTKAKAAFDVGSIGSGGEVERLRTLSASHPITGNQHMSTKSERKIFKER